MKLFIKYLDILMKKIHRVPEKKESSTQILNIDTMCMMCLWEGNYIQTLYNDSSNDSCPRCGNTEITYLLS